MASKKVVWIVRIFNYPYRELVMTRTFDKKKVAVAEVNHWNSSPRYAAEYERREI